MEELENRRLGLAARKAGLTPQQLPGVDVAYRHELCQTSVSSAGTHFRKGRGEDAFTPLAMERPSAIRDRADPRDAALLREHLEHAVAERLVVVDQDVNGPGRIADRRLALCLYLLRLPLHARGADTLAAPEPPDHRLPGHPAATGHLVHGQLAAGQLPA